MKKDKLHFIPMIRLVQLIPHNTKGLEFYLEKLVKCLNDEGYVIDANVINEELRYLKGEKVAWAVMDDE